MANYEASARTARQQFSAGNYEAAISSYRVAITKLSELIKSNHTPLRNKYVEVNKLFKKIKKI